MKRLYVLYLLWRERFLLAQLEHANGLLADHYRRAENLIREQTGSITAIERELRRIKHQIAQHDDPQRLIRNA